jgi:hypothetical protein
MLERLRMSLLPGSDFAAQVFGIDERKDLSTRLLINGGARHRGYDLPGATEHLIGLSNTLTEPHEANASHREMAQRGSSCGFRIADSPLIGSSAGNAREGFTAA